MEVPVDPGGRQTHQRHFAQRWKPTVTWQLPNIDRPFILTSHYRCETQFGCIFFSSLELFAATFRSFYQFQKRPPWRVLSSFINAALFGHGWKEQIFWVLQVFFPQHCTNNHKYWLMLSGLRCTFTEDRYCAAAKCTLSMSYNLLDAIFLLIAVHFTLKSRRCTNILMLFQYCGVVGVVVNYIVTCGVKTFYKSVAVPQCDGWLNAALPNSYSWSDRV